MTSEKVIDKLKDSGYRITKQRRLIVDVIMGNEFSSCKDIYYQVISRDKTIGMATVYRMIRQLEELDVIRRVERIEVNQE